MNGSLIVRERPALRVSVAVVTALILATVSVGCRPQPASDQAAEVLVFEGARLIPGDGSAPIENAAFVVRGGEIEQVGPRGTLQVPEGASRVDLTGKTVMPMLLNSHNHIGYLKGTTVDPENYTRENILDGLRRHQYYGVGVVLVLGTGRDDLELQIREEQRSGDLNDPNLALLLTAESGIVGPNTDVPTWAYDVLREADTEAQARQQVRELVAKRVDAIKLWVDDRGGRVQKLKPEAYRAVIDEAQRHNVKTFVHVRVLEDAKDLVRAGVDGLAHMVSEPIDEEFVQLMKEHDVLQCSALRYGGKTAWIDDPALAETVTPALREAMREAVSPPPEEAADARSVAYAILLRNVKRLSDAGVRIALCGDTGTSVLTPPFMEHMELEALAEAGIPPLQVIRAGTQTPAEFLGLRDLGTLGPGKRADFIVLNANPLESMANSRNIMAVYKGGRVIDRAALRAGWTGSASSVQ